MNINVYQAGLNLYDLSFFNDLLGKRYFYFKTEIIEIYKLIMYNIRI